MRILSSLFISFLSKVLFMNNAKVEKQGECSLQATCETNTID